MDTAAALRYVRGRQTPAGGFSFYRSWGVEEPSPADSFYALFSLAILGGEPLEHDACANWLQARQDAAGGFSSLAAGWQVLESLDLLGMPPERSAAPWLITRAGILFEAVEAGSAEAPGELLAELARFVDLWRSTGHLRLEPRQRMAIIASLERLRDARGAFPRDAPNLTDSATALRLIRALHLLPHRSLLAFARSCEDPLYGFRPVPQGHSTRLEVVASGLDVCAAFGAEARYTDAIRETLAACQHDGGGFSPQPGALPTLRDTWLAMRILQRLAPPSIDSNKTRGSFDGR
ncbi:MAG TPA: prenyltransferase/squalene oxidase repeat-containing protein [Gammaproteobacteria bacterium]|nr:prenyltransferase/squalene oxidase repeat-containing protein [Gammaproteobacteria bacterium]